MNAAEPKKILNVREIVQLRESIIKKAAHDNAAHITHGLIDHKTIKQTEDRKAYNFFVMVSDCLKDSGLIVTLVTGCCINKNFVKTHDCKNDGFDENHYLACQLIVQMPAVNEFDHNINTFDFLRPKLTELSMSSLSLLDNASPLTISVSSKFDNNPLV